MIAYKCRFLTVGMFFVFELALKHFCFTLPRVALLSPFSAAARSETHGT